MLSKRENALLALQGQKPEYVPCFYDSCQIVPVPSMDIPPIGQGPACDAFGVHQTPTDSAGGMFTPTPTVKPVLEDVTEWKSVVNFPDYQNQPWEIIASETKKAMNLNKDLFVQDVSCPVGLFERLHYLMGFENALCALYEEPEAVYDLVGAIADKKIEFLQITDKYFQPDYFTFNDDYSHGSGLMISPEIFRKIFKPHLARIVDACNKTNMTYKQHCCGKMESLLDDFLDLGITAFDPVQPMNNIPEMKKKTLGKAGIVGGLDLQNVIDRVGVTDEQIEAEAKRCIENYGADGGYMIFGSSLHMFNPVQYAPGGVLYKLNQACEKYGNIY